MKTERIEYQKMSKGKHLCVTCLHCKNMKDGEAICTTQDFVDFHPCDVITALKDWKDDPRVQRIDNGGGYWVAMCNAYEYDKHWIDYNEYINSDFWKAKKLQVIKRDHWQCQECGTAKNLEVHHLDYKRLGIEDLYDLVTLCRDCHKKAHEHDLNKAE